MTGTAEGFDFFGDALTAGDTGPTPRRRSGSSSQSS
jgi:hypothetical protein